LGILDSRRRPDPAESRSAFAGRPPAPGIFSATTSNRPLCL